MIQIEASSKPLIPLKVTHDIHLSGLGDDKSLFELLDRSPLKNIKSKAAIQNYEEQFGYTQLPLEQAKELISAKTTPFWITIHEMENDPVFGPIFLKMAETMEASLPKKQNQILYCTGSVFISYGAAVTPFHMDYGNNILLHLRGQKFFQVWNPNDRNIISKQSLEEFFGDNNPNPPSLKYSKDFEKEAINLDLEPGDGIYMPSTTPHATITKSLGDISVTLSLSHVSPSSEKLRRTHVANRRLAKLQKWLPETAKQILLAAYEWIRLNFTNSYNPRRASFKPRENLARYS